MSKRYDAVMKKVEVTDAMRRRILANIDGMDLDPAPHTGEARSFAVKRLMPLAACFVLLAAGAFSLRHFLPRPTVEPLPTEGVMVGSGIVAKEDAAALSEAVGFSVKEVTALPFQVEEVTYTAYWQELAEITYTGAAQTLTFRQSLGEGDNSGDYNMYDETVTWEAGGRSVTLKGDDQIYALAVWSDGTYAYSLRSEPGLTIQGWETVLGDL